MHLYEFIRKETTWIFAEDGEEAISHFIDAFGMYAWQEAMVLHDYDAMRKMSPDETFTYCFDNNKKVDISVQHLINTYGHKSGIFALGKSETKKQTKHKGDREMKDQFGDRMKDYENTYRIKLPKRMPVIIRIDGKAFHSYTAGMDKPFDEKLTQALWETCQYLAENIMGCKLVYHQSDEISLLLTNYHKLTTQSWFDNNLQKMVSVAASMATAKFNEAARRLDLSDKLAMFDARAYVLPFAEVTNYFLWRQQDATRNSVSMVAQANFPHKQLQHLNSSELQDKLFLEKGVNWNELPTWQKRGACIVKETYPKNGTERSRWTVDTEIPIFSQDRNYIDQYVYVNEEA